MIIVVGNIKGGTGKSTLATNLSVEATKDKKRVLLVDSDPQASAMGFRGARESDDIKATAILTPTLHRDLKDFTQFDLIIVDAGGRDVETFRSAVLAADLFIMPTRPSQYDIWSTSDTIKVLRDARIYRPDLVARVALNQLIPNTIVGREAREALEEFKDECPLLQSTIAMRVAFETSVERGMGASEIEPKGTAAEEIRSLYTEIMQILEGIE
jgi:chromosome partitioning protein